MTRHAGLRRSSWLAGAALAIVAAILLLLALRGEHHDATGVDARFDGRGETRGEEAADDPGPDGASTAGRPDGGSTAATVVSQPQAGEPQATADPPSPPAGAPIRLRILDDASARPIVDADVSVLLRGPARTASRRLRTNREGIAVLAAMPPGVYAARIRHAEHLPDRRDLRIAEAQAADTSSTDPIDIRLVRGAGLVGTVADLRGAPIARARLTLTRADLETPQRYSATSETAGTFRFAGLGEGTWTLTASHRAYRSVGPMTIDVPPGAPLSVRLADASPATVRVLDPDDLPLAGARVEAEIEGLLASSRLVAPTRSDDGGSVRLRNLPSDPSAVVALRGRHADYPDARLSTTVESLDAGSIELRFPAGREARGRVLDANGDPAPDAHVEIDGPKGLVLRSTSSGEFRFRKFPPGEYTLRAMTADRGVSTALAVDLSSDSAEDIELRLEAGDGVIAGRVLDADSVPMVLVVVTLEGAGRKVRVATDRDGGFRFSALPVGEYRIAAGGRRRGYDVIEGVRTGREDLAIRLAAPGAIRGRIEATGPAPGYSLRLVPTGDVHGASSAVRSYRFTSRASSFHLREVPAGTYRMELRREGKVVGEIDLVEVPAGGTVDGVKVVDEERAPQGE